MWVPQGARGAFGPVRSQRCARLYTANGGGANKGTGVARKGTRRGPGVVEQRGGAACVRCGAVGRQGAWQGVWGAQHGSQHAQLPRARHSPAPAHGQHVVSTWPAHGQHMVSSAHGQQLAVCAAFPSVHTLTLGCSLYVSNGTLPAVTQALQFIQASRTAKHAPENCLAVPYTKYWQPLVEAHLAAHAPGDWLPVEICFLPTPLHSPCLWCSV